MGRRTTTKTPPPSEPTTPAKDLTPEETLQVLKAWGTRLDQPTQNLPFWSRPIPEGIETGRELLMTMLKIRNKRGRLVPLRLNRPQHDMERTSGNRNIVLKARQLGITTYVAARFFVSCITREGTLSVQVAHDQRSAEEIFRIVHRLLENLPESLRQGVLVTSRANVRQIVFPMLDSEYRVETAADPNAGRGLTIHNLHCSEVARWPRDVSETLASLRAAVPPDGEIFLESTPNGAGGTFYDEWQRAPQTGYVRHFYPWWWDPHYRRKLDILEFSDQERELMQRYDLDAAQIAFRREMRANFGNRAPEEYAEDPDSCFLASGDCVFDCDVLDERLKQPPVMAESTDNGKLLTFFPPVVTPESVVLANETVSVVRSWAASETAITAVVVSKGGSASPMSLDDIRGQLRCGVVGVVPPSTEPMPGFSKRLPITISRPGTLVADAVADIAKRLASKQLELLTT